LLSQFDDNPRQVPFAKHAGPSNSLHGCNVFSKIDLVKGYHQIPVAAANIPKMAIITPFGLFEYLFTPFGLSNAAQAFQCMMDRINECLDLPCGLSGQANTPSPFESFFQCPGHQWSRHQP
jgi:hypothetical protein